MPELGLIARGVERIYDLDDALRVREALQAKEQAARELVARRKCPTCRAPMKSVPQPHDCRHDARCWRFVLDTRVGDGWAVVSIFDPEVWAVYCRGYGITELIPRDQVPDEWSSLAYADPNFDPNERTFRGRDPFAFDDHDPFARPLASFAALRDGYNMKHWPTRDGL